MKGACPGNFPSGKSPGFTLQLWGQSFVWHLFTWHGAVMWSAWSIKACNNKRLSMFVCLHLSQCLNSLPWGKPPRKQHENAYYKRLQSQAGKGWPRSSKERKTSEPKNPSTRQMATFPYVHSRQYSNIHQFPSAFLDAALHITLSWNHSIVSVLRVPRGRGSASIARERGIPTSGHTQSSLFNFKIKMAKNA